MQKLTKALIERRDELANGLEEAWKEIEDAGNDVENAVSAYNEKVDAYNEKLTEVNDWVEEQATDMRQFFDEKSEKWQEGEKGGAYNDWINEWEQGGLDELSPIDVEYVDEPDHADALRELPEEPS